MYEHDIYHGIILLDSVNNELRSIEGKRQKLLGELALSHRKIEDVKAELERQEGELEKLKLSVKQVNLILLPANAESPKGCNKKLVD